MNNDPVLRQIILENYQHPYHQLVPEEYSHSCNLVNQSCGDEVTAYLETANDTVENIYFESRGCALSIASASLLSQVLENKRISEILQLDQDYLKEILGTELSPTRVKCAYLPLQALQEALRKSN